MRNRFDVTSEQASDDAACYKGATATRTELNSEFCGFVSKGNQQQNSNVSVIWCNLQPK